MNGDIMDEIDEAFEMLNDKRSLKEKSDEIVGYRVKLILDGTMKSEDIMDIIENRQLTEIISAYGDGMDIVLVYPVMPDKMDFEMLSMVPGIKSIDDSMLY